MTEATLPTPSSFIFPSRASTNSRPEEGGVGGLDLHIRFLRIYAESHVAGKGPGSRGPCQDVCVLSLGLKPNHRRALLYVLISLGHLMAGKGGTAARAVGNDLKALIKKALVPDLL